MMISVENSKGLERRLKVQVPADRIEKEIDERLRSYGRTAKLKGFRPGKVPFNVIRRRYGQQVRREVLHEVMQSSFLEAINREKLNPAGGPRIEPEKIEQGKDLTYTATFEVYPEVKLKTVEGLKVERPTAQVQASDVDAMLEHLRRQRATWEPVDGPAAKSDRVTVDFEGQLAGEPFEGGSGKEVPVVIGSGGMLEDFERALEGIRAGEQRTFQLKFPKDYRSDVVAGRKVEFNVRCSRVEGQRLAELDEAFCRSFGIEEGGIERLRSEVADNMRREMDETVLRKQKQQVLDALVGENPVEVPKALVEAEIEQLQEEMARQWGLKDPSRVPPAGALEASARRRVALSLLITELVKREKLTIDRSKVNAKVESMAADYDNPQEMTRRLYASQDVMQRIEAVALEEQVVEWLLERAKVKEKRTSFKELMKFDQ